MIKWPLNKLLSPLFIFLVMIKGRMLCHANISSHGTIILSDLITIPSLKLSSDHKTEQSRTFWKSTPTLPWISCLLRKSVCVIFFNLVYVKSLLSSLLVSGLVQYMILKLYVTTGIAKVFIVSMQFAELSPVFRIVYTLW